MATARPLAAPLPALLDVDRVRSHFPGLASGWAFFDNAGGSQVLAEVAERVRDYMLTTSVQLGATYDVSRLATERVAAGARAMATLLNADPGEIVLGASATQLVQNLARALEPELASGDEIVVTNADHAANWSPWQRLAMRGVVIRDWKVDPETLELDLGRLAALLTPRTRIVAVTQASNVLGTVVPVAEVARLAHATGARVVVDGVAYAPHRAVDVRALDADFYVVSCYKLFGPHAACLFGKREHLLELATVNHLFVPKDALPYKLQPGGAPYELSWGLTAVAEYLEELGREAAGDPGLAGHAAVRGAFDAIAAHEEALAERLLEYLAARPGVRLIGRPGADRASRVATVSFVVEGRHASEIPAAVDRHRVGIRWGDFHARRLIEELGLAPNGGVVRISMAHYNTHEEMDRLLAALDEALPHPRPLSHPPSQTTGRGE